MNRIILMLLSAVLSLTAMSQRTIDPKVSIGVKGGMTLGSMQFSPAVRQSFLQGMTGGVAVRYSEEKLFGLLIELNMDQRGWKEDFEEQSDKFSYSRCLSYIQLPVMTHINFGSRRIRGFVNLGPSVGYMIGSKIDSDFDYANTAEVTDFPRDRRTDQLSLPIKNKFDYGICAGAGIEICPGKRNSLMLEGRYYFGLGSIFSSRKSDPFTSSRTTSIQVSLCYLYRLK